MPQKPSLSLTLLGSAVLVATLITACGPQVEPPVERAVLVNKGQLFSMSLGDGADILLPPLNPPMTFSDLARHPLTHELYAVAQHGLYTVDPSTGHSTFIGNRGMTTILNSLAFTPDGSLYGGDEYGRFYRIDPATGHAAVLNEDQPETIFAGDLAAAPDGTLYATVIAPQSNRLVRINPTTGEVSNVGLMGFDDVYGLTFKGSTLYGVTQFGEVLTVDRQTGAAQLLRETALRNVFGLE